MTEQLYLDGTAPVEIPKVRDAMHAWLDARDEQYAASEKAKAKRDAMLMHMLEAGVERYPYVDAKTGKRRFVLADKTPKAKTMAAAGSPGERKRGRRGRDKDVTVGDEVTAKNADVVESRRVSREAVADEIGEHDGFAATRAKMDAATAGGVLDDAAPHGAKRKKARR